MDLGLLIRLLRLLPDCCTLAFPLCNCCWPSSCWRKDWMYAPSKHANTKSSSSWAFMMLSRRNLRIQLMIAIAWEAFFLYRGHKRAPKLPGVHVSSVESLDRTWKTCQTLIRTWETWGTPSERDGPGGNVLASVVDRGPNRSAPWSLRDSAPFPPRPVTDIPW